jgi:hypothetical protein
MTALRKLPLLIRKLFLERFSYLRPSRNPHTLFGRDILDEILQSLESTRSANDAVMQSNCHHLRCTGLALFVQHIESVADVFVKATGAPETRTVVQKLEVVAVVAVRDH